MNPTVFNFLEIPSLSIHYNHIISAFLRIKLSLVFLEFFQYERILLQYIMMTWHGNNTYFPEEW